jgi:hypothetical protein
VLTQIATVASLCFVSPTDSSLRVRRLRSKLWTTPVQLLLGALRESVRLTCGTFRRSFSLVCVLCSVLVGNSVPGWASPSFSHVFVVLEENHSYSQVLGNSSMPYFNSLIHDYGLATQYFANGHPSLPNYLWLTSGSNDGISNDECESTSGPLNVDNAVRDLSAPPALHGGLIWRACHQ